MKINEPDKNCYYSFGKEYFGPFLLGFTRWLNDELYKSEIKKVFFFARDGYMMEKAYNLVGDSTLEKSYVYFSRNSIRQALLCYSTSYMDSLKYLSIEKYISLGKILEYYGFTKDEKEFLEKENNWDLFEEFELELLPQNSRVEFIYNSLKKKFIRSRDSRIAYC